MDIDSIKLMLEVAERGGFAAAARARGLDPSAVSRQVAQMEAALGARLFERTTRRLSVTESGAAYLARAREALELLDAAAEHARGGVRRPTGRLTLTASTAFAQTQITPLLPEFLRAYPELSVELRATDAALDLVAEGVDLAVRLGPEVRGDVICAKLRATRYRVCASPSYLAAAPALRDPADLARHACVRFAFAPYRDRWRFRRGDAPVFEASVSGRLTLSAALDVRDAAVGGLGPALLADWLADAEIAAGRLIDLFPEHEATATDFDTAIWLAYPSRAYLPSKTRAAIDFLRARLM